MSFSELFKSNTKKKIIEETTPEVDLFCAIRDDHDEDSCDESVRDIIKNAEKIDLNYAHYNEESEDTETCLYLATEKKWYKVCKTLLKFGANIDSRCTENEWTALFLATLKQDTTSIRFLIDNGAQVNFQDNSGWTPLFVAANEGFKDCLSLLLERGGNPLIENSEPKTAYDYSRNPQIKKIFENHIESSTGKDQIISNLEKEIRHLKEIINEQRKLIDVMNTSKKLSEFEKDSGYEEPKKATSSTSEVE